MGSLDILSSGSRRLNLQNSDKYSMKGREFRGLSSMVTDKRSLLDGCLVEVFVLSPRHRHGFAQMCESAR